MLKLLIGTKRHELRREYLLRLCNVYLFILIIILGVIATLLYIPYIFVRVEDAVVTEQLATAKTSDGSKQKEDFEKLTKHVEAEHKLFAAPVMRPYKILQELLTIETPGVAITSMNFLKVQEVEGGEISVKIEVAGNASSRDALVAYSKKVQTNPIFKSVDLPFSNFTKESDIPFSATIHTAALIQN